VIDLSQRTEPYELELPYGLRVTVRPLTTAGMAAAQAAARRAVEAIERQARDRTEAGLPLDGLRPAPSGHVIGIHMNAALRLAAARGCDLPVLSELLPAAEAGLIEALRSDRVRDDDP